MRWIAVALVAVLLVAGCAGPADKPSTTTKPTVTKGSASSTTGATTTSATATTETSATTTEETSTFTGTETQGGPPTEPPPPPTKPTFNCPDGPVEEEHATHGSDGALPNLAWAAVKTGNRFAVVWGSASPTTGSLRYSVNGGGFSSLAETVPTKAHVFVLESLAQDGFICFEASEGATKSRMHAARLSNAMHAFDERSQSYTLNLMVLVNELGDRVEIDQGADLMAQMLYDATDGWVRMGNVLIVINDFQDHNAGFLPCAFLNTAPNPPCAQYWDTIFTNDAHPAGAASTTRKGIRDPYSTIWMNQYHQAMPGPFSLDETGAVWLHEVGHYAFDMDDLYGDNTVITSECYDETTGISIMAGSREATEFDDPVAPCKNQPAGYTTSWQLMQGEFPKIPNRPNGPVQGPAGHGGAYQRFDYPTI